MNSDTQRIRPVDGDLSTHQAYQARYGWREVAPRYDAEQDACKIIVWIAVSALALLAVAGLVLLRGCR
jgi:hypothetical protein